MMRQNEIFISVDVETSGPIPGEYSILSIGACLVHSPSTSFDRLLKPLNRNFDAAALAVTGFSIEQVEMSGVAPHDAMADFNAWVKEVCVDDALPVLVGLNAPFDWSFVNYYFHRFIGENPFGFTAIDIKAYYMGAMGCSWCETRSSAMAKQLHPAQCADHTALQDAIYQAELFRLAVEFRRNMTRCS